MQTMFVQSGFQGDAGYRSSEWFACRRVYTANISMGDGGYPPSRHQTCCHIDQSTTGRLHGQLCTLSLHLSIHLIWIALQQCSGCQSSPRQNSCHANLPTKQRGDRRYSAKRKWLLRRRGSDDFDQVTTDFRRRLIAMVAT